MVDRTSGTLAHRRVHDLPQLIRPADVVVINTSRVMPARLRGVRDNGRPAEVLLVHPEPGGMWLAMVHPGGKLKPGRRIRLGDDASVEIHDVVGGGLRRVRLLGSLSAGEVMERHGSVPLPPYIERAPEPEDRERYQTVYAREEGSVAAPTAGLHFTPALLEEIRDRGTTIVELLLHVGPGTFKPVETEDPSRHPMHAEWFAVPQPAARVINDRRAAGGRVIAVGTTAARALESGASPGGTVRAGEGWTDLFIRPGYEFRTVDALLTNFHLPRSTLLMLVAAFAGYQVTMHAYQVAIAEGYRLYSYGDAMLVE